MTGGRRPGSIHIMPSIAAVASAPPPHAMPQSLARDIAAAHFRDRRDDVGRLAAIFEHAGIETRRFCVPAEWFRTTKTFREKNDLYIEWSTRLGAEAAAACARRAEIPLERVTHIVFVSTTGLSTPSVDARLMNVLALDSHVVRVPLWGLGCAGGAAGLGLAWRLARAEPGAVVLLVAVELCGLTFHFEDFSRANFVACALFADGAAAAMVTGDEWGARGPAIRAARSTTWPASLDVMGWSFDSVGMQVVFSQQIPRIVRERVRQDTEAFLGENGQTLEDLRHLVAHPGGAKVIAAYEEALALGPERMEHAREVLREHGNMSSVSVLYVLERFLRSGEARSGDLAMLTALGPGFSAEKVLLSM